MSYKNRGEVEYPRNVMLFIKGRERMKKKFDVYIIISFLVCVCFSFSYYTANISGDNMNYAVEELHQFNPSIFENNIGILVNGYSPRYLANGIVSFLMNVFRLNWVDAATLIIRFNYFLYGIAAVNSAYRISHKNYILYGVLLVSCIHRSVMGSIGFGTWGAGDVFLGTGIPLALLAISFIIGEKKKWTAAWLLVALAGVMHVHEGMWGGCVVGVIWLAQVLCEKQIKWKTLLGLPIYIITMLIVVVPSLLSEEVVDNNVFVDIYAFFRTPHHLVPTTWGIKPILICLGLVLFPVIMIVLFKLLGQKKSELFREELFISAVMAALWIGILLVEIYVTVINPNATVITMYITKCFKYITFVSALLILKLSDYCFENKSYISMALLSGILICGEPYYKWTFVMITAILVLTLLQIEKKIWNMEKQGFLEIMEMSVWIGVMAGIVLTNRDDKIVFVICFCAILFIMKFVYPYIVYEKISKYALGVITCILIIFSLNGRIFHISVQGVNKISGTECLKNTVGTDLYQLSLDFQSRTDNQDEFLTDPYNSMAGWIQVISQRNCYAIHKCIPSSKSAVIEWYDRIQKTSGLSQMYAKQVAELLEEINLKYVLILPEQFETIESSGQFETVVKNTVAGIYKLK